MHKIKKKHPAVEPKLKEKKYESNAWSSKSKNVSATTEKEEEASQVGRHKGCEWACRKDRESPGKPYKSPFSNYCCPLSLSLCISLGISSSK